MEVHPATADDLAPIWDAIVADDLHPQRDGQWFGAFLEGRILGASHVVTVGRDTLFDDLWVRPDLRGAGIGAALVRRMQTLYPELWLIADPDRVAYYERFGFAVRHDPPDPIARRYESLGLWPGHLDHVHVAMHWPS